MNSPQPVALTEKVMTLAVYHFALRLARLGLEMRPLAFDPAELADDCQADCLVADPEWCSHPYPAMRRIDPQVQVLDVLSDNMNRQATDGDLVGLSIHSGFSRFQEVYRVPHR